MCIKTNIRDLEMANDKELKQECMKRLEILKFDDKVIEDIYDFLEENEEINNEELIKIFEKNNNYIIEIGNNEEKD